MVIKNNNNSQYLLLIWSNKS